MHGTRITILRILKQENGEERYDSCAGVDDELPSVRIMKQRAGDRPTYDNENRYGE